MKRMQNVNLNSVELYVRVLENTPVRRCYSSHCSKEQQCKPLAWLNVLRPQQANARQQKVSYFWSGCHTRATQQTAVTQTDSKVLRPQITPRTWQPHEENKIRKPPKWQHKKMTRILQPVNYGREEVDKIGRKRMVWVLKGLREYVLAWPGLA